MAQLSGQGSINIRGGFKGNGKAMVELIGKVKNNITVE